MQRKKNIRLLVSLTVLIATIAMLFLFSSKERIEKRIFQIENLEKIDRVVLQSNAETTELKFNGTRWMVNGANDADRQMITVLFAALKQVEAKTAVASGIQDSIKKEIEMSGVKVSCYEGEILAKEFRSYGNEKKSVTYFQLGDGDPYIVTIPGYRVYVASVFEVPTSDWRDKTVFNFNWQNLKSVEVTFPNDDTQSFKASFQNRIFSIENLSQTDTTKLAGFMDALIQLKAEKILTAEQAKKYDSLLSTQPIETINIQDIGNRFYEVKIFPFMKNETSLVAKRGDEVIELNPATGADIYRKKNHFLPSAKRSTPE